ncbi:MAG TPA: hypothetical protein VKA13_07320 [Gammaproteobacteria bacterium]|nr:hypothetical protein [Gammaproteobacteria bacterium]
MKPIANSVRSFWSTSIVIAMAAAFAGAVCPASVMAAGKNADIGHLGVGLAWQPLELGGNTGTANTGYVTGRYWFNKQWGLDGGLGMGLPSVSSPSRFMVNLSVQPMYALKRWGTSVFYANAHMIPSITTGNGTALLLSFSAGVGIEAALPGIDEVRWFMQLNPFSVDYYSPPVGGSSTGLDFFGAVMPVSVGLHYYF